MATVQIIKATKTHEAILQNKTRKLRAAAYARVSTEKEQQEYSYETQCRYYTELIQSNPNYEFVEMYADEGLTGTMLKKRDGFLRMIDDAMNGKIDVIYIKSISRFARNTVDCLTVCRNLKSRNVNIFFEKENIELQSQQGELALTLMACIAQEESHSISENIKWTIRKNYERGVYHMPYNGFLGYEKGTDGKPRIVEEEAEIVRKIYKLFLYGYSISAIAKELTEEGIPTPRGKKEWRRSTVRSILSNEKYIGDARLQKTYTPNFLDHRLVKNEGQVPSYYVTDDHEPIISRDVFSLVQEMLKSVSSENRNCGDIFSRKLFCACGAPYGRKVHHSNSKYRTIIYRCNSEYKTPDEKHSARLNEEQIKAAFVEAINLLLTKDTLIEDVLEIARLFEDTGDTDSQLAILADKQKIIEKEIEQLIEESSKSSEVDSYRKRYDALTGEYDRIGGKMAKLQREAVERKAKYEGVLWYAAKLRTIQEPIEVFDEELWHTLLDRATVTADTLVFIFKDGTEIEIEI